MFGLGEVARGGVVHHGVRAVPFAGVAVTIGAVFVVDGFCRVKIGVIGRNRILAELVFEGDAPRSFVQGGHADRDEDQDNDQT